MSDDEDDQPDPILRLLGPVLVGRARAGEIGVFASIETQNLVLDSIGKAKRPEDVQALKQIFDETKVPRARAHKLERLVSERIQAQGDQGTTKPPWRKPEAPAPVSSASSESGEEDEASESKVKASVQTKDDNDAPKRKQTAGEPANATAIKPRLNQTLKTISPPQPYHMTDRLRELRATVRVRSDPYMDADQIGIINDQMTIYVDGLTQDWLRIKWSVDQELPNDTSEREDREHGWVVRASPDGQPLFTPLQPEKEASIAKTTRSTETAAVENEKLVLSKSQQQESSGQTRQQTVTIPAEDFYRLVARVEQLEQDLTKLKDLLRSA